MENYHKRYEDLVSNLDDKEWRPKDISSIPEHSRIILWGGGVTGKNIYPLLCDRDDVEVVAWVDSNYAEMDERFSSPDIIFQSDDYDLIILAMLKNNVDSVRNYLVEKGIDDAIIIDSIVFYTFINLPDIYVDKYEKTDIKSWDKVHEVEEFALENAYCTTSMICTQEFMDMPFCRYWSGRLYNGDYPVYNRKWWEACYISQALYERGFLKRGSKGVGFGVGEERLVDLYASFGCDILATDLSAEESAAAGWMDSNQNAGGNLEKLRKGNICTKEEFYNRVTYRDVDMNEIPEDIAGYDFCWSACSLEHIGSMKKGMEFVINSMKTLRPGGVAIHTTEYNLYSDDKTIDVPGLCIFRKKDMLYLAEELERLGYRVEPFDWNIGHTVYDGFVDLPPYCYKDLHLRFLLEKYPTTSVGIIVYK